MNYKTIKGAVTVPEDGGGSLLAGRYRAVRQLGQGGMGSVWLAEDMQLDGKLFAIKMLPSILVSNKRAYRQLKDEALVAMKLAHPNIVTLRAFEENDGAPFLVMDYVDGETLDDYLAKTEDGNLTQSRREAESQRNLEDGCFGCGIPEEDVIRILKPIAAALDYAHGEGVIHRDVKPANVMIRKDGHPFILDFGIAREVQETMTRMTGALSSGTLPYMSPEQLRGAKPTAGQDVYSFAAMVYECLAGDPPFSRGQIEYQILNEAPEPLANGIRVAVYVMAGLAKKPDDRPATCAGVLGEADCSRVEQGARVETAGRVAPEAPQTVNEAPVPHDRQQDVVGAPSTWKIPVADHKVRFMWTSWCGILVELLVLLGIAGWIFGLVWMTGVDWYVDSWAYRWNLGWMELTAALEFLGVALSSRGHILWSWFLKVNFVWILLLSQILDYSDTSLEKIDGVAYDGVVYHEGEELAWSSRYSHDYSYNREAYCVILKKSRSEWIVKHKPKTVGSTNLMAKTAPAQPADERVNPIQKGTNTPQVKPSFAWGDDCYVLRISSSFMCYYIPGVLILLVSALGLWGMTFLPGFIRRRTEAVLGVFDAKNWYNAQRRLFLTFQNDRFMLFFRAVCFLEGLGGCAKNISRAKKLFRKSANQGLLESFCALGYINQHGLSGEVDLTQARGYYAEAKNLGCELAAKLLDGVPSGT